MAMTLPPPQELCMLSTESFSWLHTFVERHVVQSLAHDPTLAGGPDATLVLTRDGRCLRLGPSGGGGGVEEMALPRGARPQSRRAPRPRAAAALARR